MTLLYAHVSVFTNSFTIVAFSSQGPQFYINMASKLSTNEIDEKESCFGHVVEGREVLDHIMKPESKSLSMIGIKSIQVVL